MDKAQQESLIEFFNVDFDPKTNVEYRKGSKKSFYLEKLQLQDDYNRIQAECRVVKDGNVLISKEVLDLEEIIKGQKRTIDDLEAELNKVRSQCDSLKADNSEAASLLALKQEEIQGIKEVAAEWEHRSKSVRKIPLLGTDTLSYQSDILLRWQEHLKEWNDLVSDFQKKYLPPLKEGFNSFVTRVKNVEI